MKKKLIALILAATAAALSAVMLAGCGNKNYPVEVANFTIEKEPKNVVVLDAATADIMSYIGYDRKFAGRSEDVDQQNLSAAPLVGTSSNPDVEKISDLGADLVFSNDTLSRSAKEKLEKNGIKVIKLQQAQSSSEVKTNYETLGKILGGNNAGKKEGTDAYNKLIEELEKLQRSVEGKNGAAKPTICYLYTEGSILKPMSAGSFGSTLMGYTSCMLTADNIDLNKESGKIFENVNPDFIFYADESTRTAITSDPNLSKSTAVKNNQMAQIPYENMCRPGQTAINTLKTMIDFIYQSQPAATVDEAPVATAPAATQPAATEPSTTVPATTAPAAKDLSGDYGIKLDGLSLKKEDDNDNVKAMQQRLEDLKYLDKADENVTGYYGSVTEAAVKAFQKKNGIKETGTADNATLKALFQSTAK